MGKLVEYHQLLASTVIDMPPLVEGLVTNNDKIMLVAAAKTGKSVLALQLANCVASSTPFLGFTVPKAERVLYIAGEGDIAELYRRGHAMSPHVKAHDGKLLLWSLPEIAFNTKLGTAELLRVGVEYKPALTIFDPVYTFMEGSMRDDEKVGAFVRALNLYQDKTGSALVVIHHTHRAIRLLTGAIVEEGDDSFYGNMLFKAWPHSVLLLHLDKQRYHVLSCRTHRESHPLVDDPLTLVMVQPKPLYYTKAREGVTPTEECVLAAIRLNGQMTKPQLEKWLNVGDGDKANKNKHASVFDAVAKLMERGEVIPDGREGKAISYRAAV